MNNSIYHSKFLYNCFKQLLRFGKSVFYIVDDTISSKSNPSSQVVHLIEYGYFHQSHLKGKQDYGNQAVAVMFSCNGILLKYEVIIYDKMQSKIKNVEELSVLPVCAYFLCDSWYACSYIMDAFIKKGFYIMGALKTNQILYPYRLK